MGFDDRNERSLGDEDASYTTAIPMWADFMAIVVAGRDNGKVPDHSPRASGVPSSTRLREDRRRQACRPATIYYRTDLRHEAAAPASTDP